MSRERKDLPENPFMMACDDRRIALYLDGTPEISVVDKVLVAMHLLRCDKHGLPPNFRRPRSGVDK